LAFLAAICCFSAGSGFFVIRAIARKGNVSNTPKKIYYPPKPEFLDKYSLDVCKGLTKKHGSDYYTTEFISEFTNFVKLVVKVQVKHLNGDNTREDAKAT